MAAKPKRITGDPAGRYSVRERVRVLYKNTWYDGKVIAKWDQAYTVSYDGYDDSWNETVGPERLQRIARPTSRSKIAAGERVLVKWGSEWYRARITAVESKQFAVTYEGYASNWDEVVPRSRIKTLAAAKAAKIRAKRR